MRRFASKTACCRSSWVKSKMLCPDRSLGTWSILVVDFESWELQKCSLQNTFQEFLRWKYAKDPWGLLKPETIWNVKLLKLSSVKAKLERFWIFVPVVWEMISWRRFLRWNLSRLHECPCPQMHKNHNTDSVIQSSSFSPCRIRVSWVSWVSCLGLHVLFNMCASLCMLFLHAPGPAIHVFGVLSIAPKFSNTTTGHNLVILFFMNLIVLLIPQVQILCHFSIPFPHQIHLIRLYHKMERILSWCIIVCHNYHIILYYEIRRDTNM